MRFPLPLLVLAAGCPRKIPDHLRLDPPDAVDNAAVKIDDVGSALRAMLGADPLARSPQLPDPSTLASIEGGLPLEAYVHQIQAVERGEGQVERALQQLEDEWRSTAVVALSRGYRLRIAENQLAQSQGVSERNEDSIVSLVTPLTVQPTEETLPRTALEWLVGEERLESTVRAYADRWVLEGWLADPAIPVEVLSSMLQAPQYDDLRETPTGRLVLARASGATADTASGWSDLERATRLALEEVAADRDREQAAWAELRHSEGEALGTDDPIGALLKRAADQLTTGAGDDRAAGGALLALASHRWTGGCAQAPCTGVDRVETIGFAGTWDPQVGQLASVWRVVALKDALDTLEVAHETALFPEAMTSVVDALLGTGGGPLDVQLLQRRRPDASTWLAIARSIGTEGVVDWPGTRAALGSHLASEATRAEELAENEEVRALLARIRTRAIP